jgi:hypothetical protein
MPKKADWIKNGDLTGLHDFFDSLLRYSVLEFNGKKDTWTLIKVRQRLAGIAQSVWEREYEQNAPTRKDLYKLLDGLIAKHGKTKLLKELLDAPQPKVKSKDRQLLENIAGEIDGIPKDDLMTAERNIAGHLIAHKMGEFKHSKIDRCLVFRAK